MESKKAKSPAEKTKPSSSEPKQKVKIIEPQKEDKPKEETDESSDDSSDDDDSTDDQVLLSDCLGYFNFFRDLLTSMLVL